MSDSAAYNIRVIENVCERLEVPDKPKSTSLNNDSGTAKEFWSDLHHKFGNTKLSEVFVVDIEFKNESFPTKALKCLSSFINKETSAKPWN